ncbi:N-acetylmuramoyl-L-alanine amidase [Pseudoxanthomonas sp. UTMC 1351]|uniref:N-acetylmuramoyl-L-alanine amidase n=1 Tax=Pseudoxanthomonas sp. UTMC 1351 TaxID=2695853 RepID=UPI0034CF951B
MRRIDHLAVHCSATQASKPFRAADIDRWHKERGFDCIGYHYVIGLDGVVETGRPLERKGAHVSGHNVHTVGICLIGGIGTDGKPAATYSEAQYDALQTLLLQLRTRWPAAGIRGHRDFPRVAKACPCFDVPAWCVQRGIVPAVAR